MAVVSPKVEERKKVPETELLRGEAPVSLYNEPETSESIRTWLACLKKSGNTALKAAPSSLPPAKTALCHRDAG